VFDAIDKVQVGVGADEIGPPQMSRTMKGKIKEWGRYKVETKRHSIFHKIERALSNLIQGRTLFLSQMIYALKQIMNRLAAL
jgi:hypothetical protein